MRVLRRPWSRAFIAWTAILLVAAILIAIDALIGFLRAADECYFQVGPCSTAGDPNLIKLQFAVFGIPLLWVTGVLIGLVDRALTTRRRSAAP